MFSLIIDYPDTIYLPDNSLSPTTAVIGSRAIEVDRKPLVEMISQIFDGKYKELFGQDDFLMNEPKSILLTTKPRWEIQKR